MKVCIVHPTEGGGSRLPTPIFSSSARRRVARRREREREREGGREGRERGGRGRVGGFVCHLFEKQQLTSTSIAVQSGAAERRERGGGGGGGGGGQICIAIKTKMLCLRE